MPMAPLIWGSVEGQWPSPESWGRGLVTPSLRLELMIESVMFIMVNCILNSPPPFPGMGDSLLPKLTIVYVLFMLLCYDYLFLSM